MERIGAGSSNGNSTDRRVDAKAVALLGDGDDDSYCNDNGEEAVVSKRSNIVWKVSEYLFDLFDANLLDGYKKIERFEDSCMDYFIETLESQEYTFRQEKMHKEFLAIFEGLIEDYLSTLGYSPDMFYREVDVYRERMRAMVSRRAETLYDTVSGDRHVTRDYCSEASEIVDVICFYYDFPKWVAVMKDRARHVSSSRMRSNKSSTISTIEKAIINYCNR